MWTFSNQQTNLRRSTPKQFQFQDDQGVAVQAGPGCRPDGCRAPGPGGPAVLPGGTGLPAGPGREAVT